ncbi:hemerythrin-like protein [Paramagnetospirillum caucaseum]|uniref:Hemerythrin-like protein n=2 Tax=Paramagnetospirillum caucaseum TaxID=1244869 RepID=M2YFR0_9PROT|nr:hemerythrin-like protein [Paramagnetospirillum caucaseum]
MRVGIDVVDDDHQELFALVQEFETASKTSSGQVDGAEIGRILERLQAYVNDHFEREETAQLETGYEGYAENKRQHDELRHTLEKFIDKHRKGEWGDLKAATEHMRSFLAIWLQEHIMKTDRKMRGRILPWVRKRA